MVYRKQKSKLESLQDKEENIDLKELSEIENTVSLTKPLIDSENGNLCYFKNPNITDTLK